MLIKSFSEGTLWDNCKVYQHLTSPCSATPTRCPWQTCLSIVAHLPTDVGCAQNPSQQHAPADQPELCTTGASLPAPGPSVCGQPQQKCLF